MDGEGEMRPIVLDNGSGMIKAGFSGEDAPRAVFANCVGRPKYTSMMQNGKSVYVGDEALAKKGMLKLNYPVAEGICSNWDDLELVWQHCFYNELRVSPEEHPVLLTEAPLNPKVNREKMAHILFESFNCPAMYVQIQAVLSLYASGRTTGLTFDAGDGVSHVVPIYEGYSIPHAVRRINIAGRHITLQFKRLLQQSGFDVTSSSGQEIVREMKEKFSYVAEDYEQEMEKAEETDQCNVDYELPDGSVFTLGSERFAAPEIMFNPSLMGSEQESAPQMIFNSIQKCDMDLRKAMYGNIILSGGSTMTKGLQNRLQMEVQKFAPTNAKVRVTAPEERKYSVFIGGSILSSLNSFSNQWITAEEYEESGASVIHRKCMA